MTFDSDRDVILELIGAIQWLVDDLKDSGEFYHPETGVAYDTCENAAKIMEAARQWISETSQW